MEEIKKVEYIVTIQLWKKNERNGYDALEELEWLFPAGHAPIIPRKDEIFSTVDREGLIAGHYLIKHVSHSFSLMDNDDPSIFRQRIYIDAVLDKTDHLSRF